MSELPTKSLKDDLAWRKSQELRAVNQKIEELDAFYRGKKGSLFTLAAYIVQFGALAYVLVAYLVSAHQLSLVAGALLFLFFAALSVVISRMSVRRQETSEMPKWDREEYERQTLRRRELEHEIKVIRARQEKRKLAFEAEQIAAHAGRLSMHDEEDQDGRLELVDDHSSP